MKKLFAALVIVAGMIVAGLFCLVLYKGPRMTVQHHFRAYQTVQPPPVEGTVPVNLPEQLPTEESAATVRNPLPDTAENRQRGRVYYDYYCVFCHGKKGAGNGPVGESYMPAPADLRSQRIANYRDGDLLRNMLLGIGHEPVLERVVPPKHRWYLVLYVRSLK
ncbi:cytochrome C [Geotalea sp. SG265]|uniref:cytochrome C n=1 Tax=Geotalea sp. SG265 TaxID=2922867 RepID=UPI001FAF7668|nr:cytochrome C [Geotalea sp. SG265]